MEIDARYPAQIVRNLSLPSASQMGGESGDTVTDSAVLNERGKPVKTLSVSDIGPVQRCEETDPSPVLEHFRGITCLASAVSSSFVPGAMGASIACVAPSDIDEMAGRMKHYSMTFYAKRPLVTSFLGTYREISADEAAKTLVEGSDTRRGRLAVKVGDMYHPEIESEILPMKGVENFVELDALYNYQFDRLANPDLAKFLVTLTEDRYRNITLKGPDGEKLGPYGAYNYLEGKWKDQGISSGSVKVCFSEFPFFTLTAENTRDIEQMRKDMLDALTRHKSAANGSSFVFNSEIQEMLKKPVKSTTYEERVESFTRLMALKLNDKVTVDCYKGIAGMLRKKESMLEMVSHMEALHRALKSVSNVGHYLAPLRYIHDRLLGDKDGIDLFLRMIQLSYFTDDAAATMDLLKTPSDKGTQDERRETVSTLMDKTLFRTSDALRCIEENLQPGMTHRDGAEEYLYIYNRLNELYKVNEATDATVQGMAYMRNAIGGDPEEQRIFSGLFRCMGGVEGTLKTMEELRKDDGSHPEYNGTTYKERADALIGLFDHLRWQDGLSELDFLLRASHLKQVNFKDLSDLHTGILGILKPRHGQVEEARRDLGILVYCIGNNRDIFELARQSMSRTGSIAAAGILAKFVNQDPAGVSRVDRLKAAQLLLDVEAGRKVDDPSVTLLWDMEAIVGTMMAGETMEGAVKRYQSLDSLSQLNDGTGEKARKACRRIREELDRGSFYTASLDTITAEVAAEMKGGKDLEPALISVKARYLAKAYDSGGVSDASSVLLGGGRKSGVIETIEIVPRDSARDQEMVSIDGLLLPVNAKSVNSDEATASAPRQENPVPASDNAVTGAAGAVSAEPEEERPASPEELQRYREIAENESGPAGEPDEMVDIGGVMLPRMKMLNILNYFPE